MIDTIQISHNLQKSGLPPEQAEAIAQAMLSIPESGGLASKKDIAALRGEFASLKLMVAGVYALLVPILLKLFLR